MVMLEYGDTAVWERTEAALGASLTHDEVLALEFATIRAPLSEVVDFVVREARVRPGFRELVERYDPLIVSGTFHELIEPVLAREGVDVQLVANRLDARPDGWVVLPRNEVMCGECGGGCKRAAWREGVVVYACDG